MTNTVPHPSQPDDRAKRRAFERQVLPHLDALRGQAMSLTRHPEDAEDLVQDTLLACYRAWHTFAGLGSIKGWLATVLRNNFIDGYHRSTRRKKRHEALRDVVVVSEQARPTQEDAIDFERRCAAVREALDSLPDPMREALTLQHIDGLPVKEIATRMGCPQNTVLGRVHRARWTLRDGWPELGDGPCASTEHGGIADPAPPREPTGTRPSARLRVRRSKWPAGTPLAITGVSGGEVTAMIEGSPITLRPSEIAFSEAA
jgi:RNA polymerase sigma-70 factor (ECF subfamily)